MLKLFYSRSLDGAHQLAIASTVSDAARLPSGATFAQLMAHSTAMVRSIDSSHCPPLEPIDVVLITAEILTHQHVAPWLLPRTEVNHGEAFVEAACDITRAVILANQTYSSFAALLPHLIYPGLCIDTFVAERCLEWETTTRLSAYERTASCNRSAAIVRLLGASAQQHWNPDYSQMRREIDRAVVDNVGGNEARANQRERVGRHAGDRTGAKDAVLAGWARFGIRNDPSVISVRSGRTQIDKERLRGALAGSLGRGRQRDGDLVSLDEGACVQRSSITHELSEMRELQELREMRALAEAEGHRFITDAIDANGDRLDAEARAELVDLVRAFVKATAGKSTELKAAVAHQLFAAFGPQEYVAESYGVTRKALRGKLPEAREIVARIRAG